MGDRIHENWKTGQKMMEKKRHEQRVLLAGFVVLLFTFIWVPADLDAAGPAKNVILLIADGCGAEQYTFARWIKGGDLALDPVLVGGVKTHTADSVVADSAPAASAYATGVRTFDKCISVGPDRHMPPAFPAERDNTDYRPLATVLEGAKLLNKAVGVVATARVTHATPAAFAAHVPARKQEEEIMEQLVHQGLDVVFGGGGDYLLPSGENGKRSDGENLAAALKKRGVRMITNAQELDETHSGPVFGMFAGGHMAAEIDRQRHTPVQPSLKAMTQKAIEILSRDADGFFLMVEGSQIDWACHANDPAHLAGELLAYDAAAEVCLDFARKEGNTLVVALSDHNTGGFSIGNRATSAGYSQLKPSALAGPIRRMKVSAMALWKMIAEDATAETVVKVVKKDWGMDISPAEGTAVLSRAMQYKAYGVPHYAFGEILCPLYTCVGWTTHGHTGGDVPLYAYGPGSPAGLLDAPQVGRCCARALGVDLEEVTRRLYADARESLPGADISVDRTDVKNPVIQVVSAGRPYRLPVNKSLLITPDKTVFLEAPVLYFPETGGIYISMQAVNHISTGARKRPEATRNPS